MKKVLSYIFAFFGIGVGLYPFLYFFIDRKFGLLNSKSEELLLNYFWNAGFYIHIVLGGLALMIGWIQFHQKFRNKNLKLHRQIGKLYVLAALLSSLSGIYIGFYATGGIIPALGFICLGIFWFSTTLMAFRFIKNKETTKHQHAMIYSYTACFAAATLRIWLPMLSEIFGNFITAYSIVAWFCWVPNIMVAYLIIQVQKQIFVSKLNIE